MTSHRLLVVDDDTDITDALTPLLRREGFEVTIAHDGPSALDAARRDTPDLIVLDVMLPGMDGRAVLRSLRAEGSTIPVVLLTSVGEAGERARALDEGADDYLNKPFDHHELVSRARAILRRTAQGSGSLVGAARLRSGDLVADRISRRFWLGSKELTLTPKAGALLDYLLTHPDELITRDRLLEVVWGFDDPVGTRAVDHRVSELRRVLGDDPTSPRWLSTVPGQGYRFCGTVEVDR